MSNDRRRQYETATAITQEFLDASHDNLLNKLEMVVDIEIPGGGYIRASDRNKYLVDGETGEGTFYEALLQFPTIKRTLGDYLNPALEFSQLELEISNVDGRFNRYLPAGADFGGWVGKSVEVRIGLGEVASTYRTIFRGKITDKAGFRRNVSSITVVARDQFDSLNDLFPTTELTLANYPDLEPDKQNSIVPVVYGDWTVNVEPGMASVPAIVVNGGNPNANGDISHTVDLQLVISSHPLRSFDTTEVYLRRGEKVWKVPTADVVGVSITTSPSYFTILQVSNIMIAQTPDTDDQALEYGRGDEFFVKVRGKYIFPGLHDNPVAQAKDLLKTFGGLVDGDFDPTWTAFQNKSAPAESAVANIKSRIWIQDQESLIEYAMSLLEQVRLEGFVSKALKFSISSLHFDNFNAAPTASVTNFDIEKGSFKLQLDEQMNFNRAKGVFNWLPNRKENLEETAIHKNAASIAQAGKATSKKIIYPNLYVASDVLAQVKETLKITSSYLEFVDANLTWRSLLLDIGDFVRLAVSIQGTVFDSVPMLVRSIGYDPAGIKLPVRLWSFQMVPFPGYAPGYPGTVGGYTATIEEET